MVLATVQEKVKEVKEIIIDDLKTRLEKIEILGKLISVIRGSQDANLRANVILDPRKPETTSNLTANQVDFITISKTICKFFPEFEGLEDFADEFLLASASKDGWAVDRVIAYEQAINEKRMIQLGLRPGESAAKANQASAEKGEKPK